MEKAKKGQRRTKMTNLKGIHLLRLSVYQRERMKVISPDEKLAALIRWHRKEMFAGSDHQMECHVRAVRRLKNTKTFADDQEKKGDHQRSVSERTMWAVYN